MLMMVIVTPAKHQLLAFSSEHGGKLKDIKIPVVFDQGWRLRGQRFVNTEVPHAALVLYRLTSVDLL